MPLFCLMGLTLEDTSLRDFTKDFLHLKRRFFPRETVSSLYLERILKEIKGSEIRKKFRSGSRHTERHHRIGFLDELVALVERHECKVFARITIKNIGPKTANQSVGLYTSSIQWVCKTFGEMLQHENDAGIVIADSRTKVLDKGVSHSVFTQKFKAAGDEYPKLAEMPVFGSSSNHAGLQVCDLLCSGILFPAASYAYCSGHITNVHVDPGFKRLRDRYCKRIKALQFRYGDSDGRLRGGITVNDCLAQRSSAELFRS